jgi:D-alanine-D-alanine ligase
MLMLKIIVLLGGNSPERQVSLVSGAEIARQLRLNGHHVSELDPADFSAGHELIAAIYNHHPDLVFIGLHGGDGENGILQAMLEGSKIPFTGSGFKASAVAMDKLLSKFIAGQAGVPVPSFLMYNKTETNDNTKLTYDIIKSALSSTNSAKEIVIKPVDAGSSVGVHIVSGEDGFQNAITDAFKYSEKLMVEEYIAGRELTVTILDGTALPVVEIKPRNGFYDYPNKYTAGNTVYQAPAELAPDETQKVQHYAMKIWQAMECSGYGRIDFRYDGKEFYFLEVNTLPGMTPLSLTPMAAKAVGINFSELLDRIIDSVQSEKSGNKV